MKHPLAEIFGFHIINEGEQATRYRENRLCPFNNIVPNCTKNSVDDPLGVCSMYHQGEPIIICPVRFRQDWLIVGHAASFFFTHGTKWTSLGEVRLKDRKGKSVGNIDYVLVSYDEFGIVTDFASLEVQAVYISGNITGPFKAYTAAPTPNFKWSGAMYYPTPDYLSSSKKRLVPQLLSKGSIMKKWNKKQAVAIQTAFYNTLTPFREVSQEEADLTWYLYDLVMNDKTQVYELTLTRTIFTQYDDCLDKLVKTDPGEVNDFMNLLQSKLDQKLSKGNVSLLVNEE